MDGKVLTTIYRESPDVHPIDSWDEVEGEAGTHSPDAQLDPIASAEAFRQLVDLGYVEPPGPNAQETVDRCVRELKYNLARAYVDANRSAEATLLTHELWERWPDEHRFGILLIDCLALAGQVAERRQAIEELERRMDRYRAEAQAELEQRRQEMSKKSESADQPSESEKKRRSFELRKLNEQTLERPLLITSLWLRQAILEGNPAEARRRLDSIEQQESVPLTLRHQLAEAMTQLGDLENARSLLESSLKVDAESPRTHAQLAVIHFKQGRHDEAIASVTETLSLLYFQPAMHALLGQALMAKGRYAEAEKALLVAVAQNNRNLSAHEALGTLYREHLHQPEKAFGHEGRAMSLRHALASRQRAVKESGDEHEPAGHGKAGPALVGADAEDSIPAPFAAEIDPERIITVVSGLPRSGTSLMMQLLVAAGKSALTDGQRPPDEDNPLGYFEFEPATRLRRDQSWIPQARGKVVKIVAQLLPLLPRGEHYNIVYMDRNLFEVVASQRSMLERLHRSRKNLDEQTLAETFQAQTRRVFTQLRRRPGVRLLAVRYEEVITRSEASVSRLARFFGGPFDSARAVGVVRPELWRHKV
jgi:tetratricopeptide (TPR) repeat protein